MRLRTPDGGTSFYESFSDLIFGTMAIFVLLLIVMLAQIEEREQTREEKVEALEAQAEQAREQVEALTEQVADLSEAVRTTGLELVVAVDVTGSMQRPLGHLVETLTTIARVLPGVSPRVRIGVVAYRQTSPSTPPFITFPLTAVLPTGRDGGQSSGLLSRFLGGLAAEGGAALTGRAIRHALSQFSGAGVFDGSQILLVMGDVGIGEQWNGAEVVWTYAAAEQEEVDSTAGAVARWVRAGANRSVVSLYTESDNPLQTPEYRDFNRAFFRRLAEHAGQPENYTENSGKMLAYLLTAMVQDL